MNTAFNALRGIKLYHLKAFTFGLLVLAAVLVVESKSAIAAYLYDEEQTMVPIENIRVFGLRYE